ncbi:DUF1501 domain-containing protein [Candidatus Pelagisphaera phototrophica]|uniref:DUF1501 domain-containing protein n=1 Tax=Candidatus Pelagisphaera phototrophica TaxID=2684113 RepID=UPI0019F693E0|nr:DUF1501 domain-containing protein [Candidatus Pelagisphaera phototrophica]QXD30592.1 DUF1501 domain-containing protein [Candidatus Pelagisphaera phototrophica]
MSQNLRQQIAANQAAARSLNRRSFLYSMGASLGSIALTGLDAMATSSPARPLALKKPHLSPKAKNCIFLMMEGGPSHIDTFDPKPALKGLHLQKFTRSGEAKSAMESGTRYYVQSPWASRQIGQSGAWMTEPWQHLAGVADDICFYRGCQVDSVNHPTAMFQVNTGNRFGGDPAMGSWVTYGLGSENQDLPGFIVLPELSYPQGGSPNWGNGYLPAHYQGTPLRPQGSPILDLKPTAGISPEHQRENLNLLSRFNHDHLEDHPWQDDLQARIENYELAFRMQIQVPGILNIDQEDDKTKELYGIGDDETEVFGRKLLLARRLVEKGVRFVQAYSGGWDSHDFLERAHGQRIRNIDKPIAGLIKDLKQRGLLDETLIVWCGEFGRSPDNGIRDGGAAYGRDHNSNAMTMWFAGGGVNAGHTVGATDELGAEAVDVVHNIRDVHVSLLSLLGLDDNKLTYFHAGRFKQMSQFGGQIIPELIA